jgi:hypothetical protein
LWAGLVAGTGLSLPFLFAPQLVHVLAGPVRRLHPEWIDERLDRLTGALVRFRQSPSAMVACFAGAVVVQVTLVLFYYALARSLGISIGVSQLALLVPVSFLVQMLPISVNGFGVREAVFSYYFSQVGAPVEGGLVVSLLGAGLVMLFSLSGALAYVLRKS